MVQVRAHGHVAGQVTRHAAVLVGWRQPVRPSSGHLAGHVPARCLRVRSDDLRLRPAPEPVGKNATLLPSRIPGFAHRSTERQHLHCQ